MQNLSLFSDYPTFREFAQREGTSVRKVYRQAANGTLVVVNIDGIKHVAVTASKKKLEERAAHAASG